MMGYGYTLRNFNNSTIKISMKWKVYILKVKKLISFAYVLLCSTFFSAVNVFASADVGSSKLATGTTKLIDDLTKLLMVLDIPITILLVAYFSVRKGGADVV